MTDPSIFAEHTRRTGRIICQICWDDYEREQMEPVSDDPGKVWDICRECAKRDGGAY